MHEAKSHDENCVITLTYAPEHLPKNGSIVPEHAVNFMKRLREHADRKENRQGIKTYGCAEYGEQFGRPHYHIILFNYTFRDAKPYGGKPGYYTSDILNQVWGFGGTQVMDLTFDSAAYVARYIMKKLTGARAGEYGEKLPEQTICVSQKGIGKDWYKENKHKIYAIDLMHVNGQKIKPITYYDKRYEIEHTENYKKIKEKRKQEIEKYIAKIHEEIRNGNHTNDFSRRDRQRAHEKVMEAKAALLKRTVE